MKEVLAQAAKLAMQDALAHRGDRHRQGVAGPACHGASLRSSHPLHGAQLRGHAGQRGRERAVRLCPGAFGNNTEGKRGVLELASGGTLMLDEIGDMSPICRPSSCECCKMACFAGSVTSRR